MGRERCREAVVGRRWWVEMSLFAFLFFFLLRSLAFLLAYLKLHSQLRIELLVYLYCVLHVFLLQSSFQVHFQLYMLPFLLVLLVSSIQYVISSLFHSEGHPVQLTSTRLRYSSCYICNLKMILNNNCLSELQSEIQTCAR